MVDTTLLPQETLIPDVNAQYTGPNFDPNYEAPTYETSRDYTVTNPTLPTTGDLAQTTGTTYDARETQIDPTTGTVAGQLQGLLSQSSPYLDQARQSAAEVAASRGLLNSSIAVGAGERAAIESALPIAQSDATAYLQNMRDNQSAVNLASEFGAGNVQQSNLANADATNRFIQDQLASGLSIEEAITAAGISEDTRMLDANIAEGKAQSDFVRELGTIELTGKVNQDSAVVDASLRILINSVTHEQAVELESLRQEYSKVIGRGQDVAVAVDSFFKSMATTLTELKGDAQTEAIDILMGNLRLAFEVGDSVFEGNGFDFEAVNVDGTTTTVDEEGTTTETRGTGEVVEVLTEEEAEVKATEEAAAEEEANWEPPPGYYTARSSGDVSYAKVTGPDGTIYYKPL